MLFSLCWILVGGPGCVVVAELLRLCYAALAHFDELAFILLQVVIGCAICFHQFILEAALCWFSFFKVALVSFSSFQFQVVL